MNNILSRLDTITLVLPYITKSIPHATMLLLKINKKSNQLLKDFPKLLEILFEKETQEQAYLCDIMIK